MEFLKRVETIEDSNSLEYELLTLLETERYNSNIFPALLVGLESEIKEKWVSTEINLAIIKLIQFFPDRSDWNYEEALGKILLKSLLSLPKPDLRLALLMIPDVFQSLPIVETVAKLAEFLETGLFAEFWVEFNENKTQLEQLVPGVGSQIKRFILEFLGLTFASLDKEVFCAFLNVKETEITSLLHNNTVISGKFVELPKSEHNQTKPREIESLTHLKLAQIQPLMKQMLH